MPNVFAAPDCLRRNGTLRLARRLRLRRESMSELTVIMPVYNAMPYLPAALGSMLGQTLRDFELLIADDGSSDGSADYLKSLNDPRVRVFSTDHLGPSGARNYLIDLVRTPYCAIMDADDVAVLHRFELQLAYMRENPKVVLSGSQINLIAEGRTIPATPFPTIHEDILRALLNGRAVVCNSSCILRVDAVRAAGGYRLQYAEDTDLFLRLAQTGKLANLNTVLLNYRIHLRSTFMRNYSAYKCFEAYSIASFRAWDHGEPEPDLNQFLEMWNGCGRVRTLARSLDRWSAIQFRRAILELGKGRRWAAIAKMAFAAGCRPRTLAVQIVARLRRKLAPAAA